jgi:hypothetical protein
VAAKQRVIVLGARGVFGSLLVDELQRDYDVVPLTRGMPFDPRGAFAVACAAGPFQQLDRGLVRTTVDAGAHWLDIADDETWFFDLLDDAALDALARERGVAVISGLSTLPALSGALVRRLGAPPRVSLTLFIGNNNRKGVAAIASAAQSGSGALRTPDRELLRRELGIDVEAFVKFEMPIAAPLLRFLGRAPRLAAAIAKPFRFGTRGGYVEARVGERSARVSGRDQRLAILPLVFALAHLENLRGCHAPSIFDAEALLQFVEARA